MKAYLEKFSAPKALKQGPELHKLVQDQQDWLNDVQPETVERYRDPLHAIYNVARLATKEGYKAYIIRERKHHAARGIATIIPGQVIMHPDPEIGVRIGDDLDYWVGLNESPYFHAAVGNELIYASAKPNLRFQNAVETPKGSPISGLKPKVGWVSAIATVSGDNPNPPLGLIEGGRLNPVGSPAVLTIPDNLPDTFGITRDGAELQLYYGSQRVVEREPDTPPIL